MNGWGVEESEVVTPFRQIAQGHTCLPVAEEYYLTLGCSTLRIKHAICPRDIVWSIKIKEAKYRKRNGEKGMRIKKKRKRKEKEKEEETEKPSQLSSSRPFGSLWERLFVVGSRERKDKRPGILLLRSFFSHLCYLESIGDTFLVHRSPRMMVGRAYDHSSVSTLLLH